MSSTNRGGKRSEVDAYPTPAWAIKRFIEVAELPGGRWLEPCAGDGAVLRATDGLRSDIEWEAWELRDEAEKVLRKHTAVVKIGDCLELPVGERFDVAITNPPFSIAQLVLERMLKISRHVVLLLRLNYLGSEERVAFLRDNMPDVNVLPNRPIFGPNRKGKLGTDSIEYAWMTWDADNPQKTGWLRLLASTPVSERKRDLKETWRLLDGVWQRVPLLEE